MTPTSSSYSCRLVENSGRGAIACYASLWVDIGGRENVAEDLLVNLNGEDKKHTFSMLRRLERNLKCFAGVNRWLLGKRRSSDCI